MTQAIDLVSRIIGHEYNMLFSLTNLYGTHICAADAQDAPPRDGSAMPPVKFVFNSAKAIEALAYIASRRAGLTALYVSKILFYAEKWHINRYGRPIIADTYIAMPRGPVPSTVKNYLDHRWDWVDEPDGIDEAITMEQENHWALRLNPGRRRPNLELLSASDIECLNEAIAFCENKTADDLSNRTHLEKAWKNAPQNGPMNYLDFIDDDNPNKAEIVEMVKENAACGII